MPPMRKPAQAGGSFQTPMASRNGRAEDAGGRGGHERRRRRRCPSARARRPRRPGRRALRRRRRRPTRRGGSTGTAGRRRRRSAAPPTAARKNASGVARPTRPAVPCGLMLAAMLGAIRATEMPTACQTERLGRRPLSRTGADMMAPTMTRSISTSGQSRAPYVDNRDEHSILLSRHRAEELAVNRRGAQPTQRARREPACRRWRRRGWSRVATTFVDNSGIARVKAVPLAGCRSWPAGASASRRPSTTSASTTGSPPRRPARARSATSGSSPTSTGWWCSRLSPAGRGRRASATSQEGEPHPIVQPAAARPPGRRAGPAGTSSVKAAFEIEWVVSVGTAPTTSPRPCRAPATGWPGSPRASDYCRDVIAALAEQGLVVEQFHPEYAAGQFELSVVAGGPGRGRRHLGARAAARSGRSGSGYGYRTSFSPKVDTAGVGNGGHVHLSLWRDEQNLMAGGDAAVRPDRRTARRSAPASSSTCRRCWRWARRASRRTCGWSRSTGPAPTPAGGWRTARPRCGWSPARPAAASGPPTSRSSASTCWPTPTCCSRVCWRPDRPAWPPGRRCRSRSTSTRPRSATTCSSSAGSGGCPRRCESPRTRFAADSAMREAFGDPLVESIVAVRESELELFDGASPEDVAAAVRWAH